MIAWKGSATRDGVLAQIEAAITAGTLLPDVPSSREQFSVVRALNDSDLDGFEEVTGVPATFALLLETLLTGFAGSDPVTARDIVRDWLAAIAPGTDMERVAAQVAILMLDRVADEHDHERDPQLTAAIVEVRKLHAAATTPDRRAWSEARAAALAATDAANHESDRRRGALAESLAWPAARSRTVLSEAAQSLCGHVARREVEAAGWTDAKRAQSEAVMNRIWDQTAHERECDPAAYNFHSHFVATDPALAQEFSDALALENSSYVACAIDLSRRIIALLASSSVTPASTPTFAS